jgi:MFS family permease
MYSSVNSDSDEDFFDAKEDVEPSGEIVVEELKDGEIPTGSKIKSSRMASALRSRAPPVIMCPFLPWQHLRVVLKRGVSRISMIACYSYDTALFLIFAVNVAFHVEQDLSTIEFSLLISCVIFAFLFELFGRRKVFTMRLIITSGFSFMVAFGWFFQQWYYLSWLEFFNWQTTAFTMCSVSLSVPFIADFVKFKKRGLAYSYTALLFATCLVLILSIVNLDSDQRI